MCIGDDFTEFALLNPKVKLVTDAEAMVAKRHRKKYKKMGISIFWNFP
jgi:hypothetical protein